ADAIVVQWTQLHGVGPQPDRSDRVEGYPRRAWLGAKGEPLVEQYEITGMAHGIPLDGRGEDSLGEAGAHMLDVGLSSTARIAAFFGIAPQMAEHADSGRPASAAGRATPAGPKALPQLTLPQASGARQVIEDALRKAGLMR
ncbi:MAG TPA: hypothetical protein VF688_08630, partial [Allosphingosinicella sp.]